MGLSEHDVTDVTSLYSLEEGFDSAKPTPPAPIPNAAIKRQSQLWWYHSLQQILLICKGKLAIFLKKIILKLLNISVMGSEIKLSEEGATYCVKSLNLLEGEDLIPLPTSTCDKITGRVWEPVGFQPVLVKQLVPCQPSPMLLLFIAKFKDWDCDKKLSAPTPKSELGDGGEFKYLQKYGGNKWQFSFPVFAMKLCKLLLHCLLLAAVGSEPCLPLEARGGTAAEFITFWKGKKYFCHCASLLF